MTLIRQGQTLLRVGGSLAGSTNCCCDTDLPYSICGRRCAWRIENGPIDSEMGACEGNDPQGWDSITQYGCDQGIDFFGRTFPYIDVSRYSCESSPEEFETDDQNPAFCYERLTAGFPIRYPPIFGNGLFGASGALAASGYKDLPAEDGSYISRYLTYDWDLWITCVPTNEFGEAECDVCNGRKPLLSYRIGAYLEWSVSEQRRDANGQITNGYIRSFATLSGDNSSVYGPPFYQQEECSELTNFTQKPQYDPPDVETPREGCVAVPDFYIAENLAIEISAEDGVTIGEETFAWTSIEEVDWAEEGYTNYLFTPEVPDELKMHDGITFYLADACCTEDYCNPLP